MRSYASAEPRRRFASGVALVDSAVPAGELHTMQALVQDATAQPRQRIMLLGGFALLALLLSVIGVYGLIAQNTAQRTSEIGIRMALGAAAGDVLRMVIGQGLAIAAAGIVVGVAGALALGRVLSAYLLGCPPRISQRMGS